MYQVEAGGGRKEKYRLVNWALSSCVAEEGERG